MDVTTTPDAYQAGVNASSGRPGTRLDTVNMDATTLLDREAIARACQRHGVARLRVFGSAVAGGFDANRSDIDFFVDFLPQVHDLLSSYLALNEELQQIVGRKVGLVMSDAVENPYFAAEAFSTAQDVYAA
jgi:predicted nucleotidyltransferase